MIIIFIGILSISLIASVVGVFTNITEGHIELAIYFGVAIFVLGGLISLCFKVLELEGKNFKLEENVSNLSKRVFQLEQLHNKEKINAHTWKQEEPKNEPTEEAEQPPEDEPKFTKIKPVITDDWHNF